MKRENLVPNKFIKIKLLLHNDLEADGSSVDPLSERIGEL